MAILYTLTSIAGVLFSIMLHPEQTAVGASCAGYGLLGFYLAYCISNYGYMSRQKERPYQFWFLITLAIFFFIMNMGFNFRSEYWQSDNLGHQGGYITGILVGFTFTEQYDYNATSADPARTPDRFTDEDFKNQSCCRRYACARCGLVFLILWFILLITLFFAWTDVNVEQS